MYKFAIIDDNDFDRQKTLDILNTYCQSNKICYQCDLYNSSLDFSCDIHYDALLLDIDMPKENGIAFAKRIREQYQTKIIFVTNHDDYMHTTFDVQPFHFISKSQPDHYTFRIFNLLFKALRKETKKIIVKTKKGTESILISDILYIQKDEHECELHTKGNVFSIWNTLSTLQEELKVHHFVRINQSTLVNMSYIKETISNKILLTNNQELSISIRLKTDFKKIYENYILKTL